MTRDKDACIRLSCVLGESFRERFAREDPFALRCLTASTTERAALVIAIAALAVGSVFLESLKNNYSDHSPCIPLYRRRRRETTN